MRILLVEDDNMLGNAVRDHLAAHGHAVDWMTRLDASSDARATTAYDLILLDLNLPDGRGLDFLRALRKAGDSVPVIILTAMDQLSTTFTALADPTRRAILGRLATAEQLDACGLTSRSVTLSASRTRHWEPAWWLGQVGGCGSPGGSIPRVATVMAWLCRMSRSGSCRMRRATGRSGRRSTVRCRPRRAGPPASNP